MGGLPILQAYSVTRRANDPDYGCDTFIITMEMPGVTTSSEVMFRLDPEQGTCHISSPGRYGETSIPLGCIVTHPPLLLKLKKKFHHLKVVLGIAGTARPPATAEPAPSPAQQFQAVRETDIEAAAAPAAAQATSSFAFGGLSRVQPKASSAAAVPELNDGSPPPLERYWEEPLRGKPAKAEPSTAATAAAANLKEGAAAKQRAAKKAAARQRAAEEKLVAEKRVADGVAAAERAAVKKAATAKAAVDRAAAERAAKEAADKCAAEDAAAKAASEAAAEKCAAERAAGEEAAAEQRAAKKRFAVERAAAEKVAAEKAAADEEKKKTSAANGSAGRTGGKGKGGKRSGGVASLQPAAQPRQRQRSSPFAAVKRLATGTAVEVLLVLAGLQALFMMVQFGNVRTAPQWVFSVPLPEVGMFLVLYTWARGFPFLIIWTAICSRASQLAIRKAHDVHGRRLLGVSMPADLPENTEIVSDIVKVLTIYLWLWIGGLYPWYLALIGTWVCRPIKDEDGGGDHRMWFGASTWTLLIFEVGLESMVNWVVYQLGAPSVRPSDVLQFLFDVLIAEPTLTSSLIWLVSSLTVGFLMLRWNGFMAVRSEDGKCMVVPPAYVRRFLCALTLGHGAWVPLMLLACTHWAQFPILAWLGLYVSPNNSRASLWGFTFPLGLNLRELLFSLCGPAITTALWAVAARTLLPLAAYCLRPLTLQPSLRTAVIATLVLAPGHLQAALGAVGRIATVGAARCTLLLLWAANGGVVAAVLVAIASLLQLIYVKPYSAVDEMSSAEAFDYTTDVTVLVMWPYAGLALCILWNCRALAFAVPAEGWVVLAALALLVLIPRKGRKTLMWVLSAVCALPIMDPGPPCDLRGLFGDNLHWALGSVTSLIKSAFSAVFSAVWWVKTLGMGGGSGASTRGSGRGASSGAESSPFDDGSIPPMMEALPVPPGAAPLVAEILRATDYYEVLGVPESAADEALRRAKRQRSLQTHPDKVGEAPGAAGACHRVLEAAEVLLDADQRRDYNESIAAARLHASGTFQRMWDEIYETTGIDMESLDPSKSIVIRCYGCGGVHQLPVVADRSAASARRCDSCKTRHAAVEGEVWVERAFAWNGILPSSVLHTYYCAVGRVYDATIMGDCMGIMQAYAQSGGPYNPHVNPLSASSRRASRQAAGGSRASERKAGKGGKGKRRK